MVLLFACVLAHEFGHIFTARAFGVATPDVTLLPIGGVARLERIPEKPSEEFLVAIAGPLVNVVIGLALMLIAPMPLSTEHLAMVESTKVSMIDRLAEVNFFLAIFNMIPAFPMDGGRVLRALLAIRLGHVRATEVAATIGQWTAFAFGFLGLFYNPLLIFIAIFVYLAASSEAQVVSLQAMSRDVPVAAAMMTDFATLTPDEHIDSAVETMMHRNQSEFPVVDADNRLVGLLGRGDIVRALANSARRRRSAPRWRRKSRPSIAATGSRKPSAFCRRRAPRPSASSTRQAAWLARHGRNHRRDADGEASFARGDEARPLEPDRGA